MIKTVFLGNARNHTGNCSIYLKLCKDVLKNIKKLQLHFSLLQLALKLVNFTSQNTASLHSGFFLGNPWPILIIQKLAYSWTIT